MQPETAALRQKVLEHFDHWAVALEAGKVQKLDFIVRPYLKESERVISSGTFSERRIDKRNERLVS